MPPDNEPTAVFPLLNFSSQSQSVQSQQAEFLMKLSHATLDRGDFQMDLFISFKYRIDIRTLDFY